MVAIAILAVALGAAVGGWRLLRRRERFQSLADMHAKCWVIVRENEEAWNAMVATAEEMSKGDVGRGFLGFLPTKESYEAKAARFRAAAARAALRAGYHDAMRGKYELAVSRPWLSVEADPPPPAWP
jgi:hypothetical protein